MKKKALFYKIYFSVIAIFLVALTVGLITLFRYTKAYESAQPQHIIDDIISKNLNQNDLYSLKNTCDFEISPYETEDSVNQFFADITDGKDIEAYSDTNVKENDTLVYNIKADKTSLLSLTLEKNKKAGKFGITGYHLTKCTINKSLLKNIHISFSKDTEIKINSVALQDENRSGENVSEIVQKYLKDTTSETIECDVTGLLNSDAQVTASKNGKELKVNAKDNQYTVVQDIDSTQEQQINDFALQAAKLYTAHMQNDCSLNDLSGYFDNNTEFYKNLRSTNVSFALIHDGYRFENVYVGELHRYTDNLYRCRVKLSQVLSLNGSEYTDNVDKYVYIEKIGDKYYVIDMQSVEGAS